MPNQPFGSNTSPGGFPSRSGMNGMGGMGQPLNNMNNMNSMNNMNNMNPSNNQQGGSSGSPPGQFCEMKDVTNAMGQRSTRYNTKPASGLPECKNICANELRCKATEYLNNQCNLYTSNAMTPSNGAEVSRKVCRAL